jgi:phage terminase small subunit
MPALANTRHELFAQELARGVEPAAAYQSAGYQPNPGKAAALQARPEIIARVSELIAQAAQAKGVTVERVVTELAAMAFADIGDYTGEDGESISVLAFKDLTKAQRAGICQIELVTRGADQTIRVKLWDKQRALELLGKHLGLWTPKPEAP